MLEQVFQLSSATLPLDWIYLDPNNPRFAEDGRLRVSDKDIDQEALQDELMSKMEREHAVDRLKDSMESNGYLPIDRIIVRQFKKDKYVVLEGNRRITAAKRLRELHKAKTIELEPQVIDSLKEIPLLVYTGADPDAAWIFQGLRHISGIKDWSAYTKAKLLVDHMEEQGLSLTHAGKIFGISAWGAGQWARAYYAYRQVQDHPDYHRDVDTRLFPYLQELFGRSNIPLREWMSWNESEKKFENAERFDEFLSWLYPKLNDQGEFDPDFPGNWDRRRISRAIDLRLVSDLISKHPEEFLAFRNGTSLTLAQGRAAAKEEELSEKAEDYARWLDGFATELTQLPVAKITTEGKQDLILEKIDSLIAILKEIKRLLEI